MNIKSLIEELKKHNLDSEVHICNDRGYYQYITNVVCHDQQARWVEEEDDEEEGGFWEEPPSCDGSCKKGPVVLTVD